jgi:hypothetical protein
LATVLSNGRTLCRSCHKQTDTYGWKQAWRMQRLRARAAEHDAEDRVSPTQVLGPLLPQR